MNTRVKVWLVTLASAMMLCTAVAYGATAELQRPAEEPTCLNCAYLDGYHSFVSGSADLCEGQENCEQNNCRACGGDSQCHTEPQAGLCHVECDCSPNLDAPLELDEIREALASQDAELIASVIEEAESVEFNSDRRALQVVGCGRVVRHIQLDEATAAALDDLLAPPAKLDEGG